MRVTADTKTNQQNSSAIGISKNLSTEVEEEVVDDDFIEVNFFSHHAWFLSVVVFLIN